MSLLAGIGVACMFHFMKKVALFGAGAFLGAILGQFLYNLIIYKLDELCGGAYFYWITLVILAIVCALLTVRLRSAVWICVTSISGAYLAVKSAGKLFGHYPDEGNFVNMMHKGNTKEISIDHWIYFGCSCA